MGNHESKEASSYDDDSCTMKQRKLLREAGDLNIGREVSLQNMIKEDELARKMATSRYLFWYTGFTIPPITVIALKEYQRIQSTVMFAPVCALFFAAAYLAHYGFGDLTERIRNDMSKIRDDRKELFETCRTFTLKDVEDHRTFHGSFD